MKPTPVLDHGYVHLRKCHDDDLTIVNAARVSYAKESTELTKGDIKLLNFLARKEHTSPFRHAILTFEVYAPLMVARQWWKYRIGSGHLEEEAESTEAWNESSRRYITEEPVFYVPDTWRSKPADSKQGSGEPILEQDARSHTLALEDMIQTGMIFYQAALNADIAPEQARLFLPAYAMYVRWWWTVSLQGAMHFVNQRIEHDAQWEIQQYAIAIKAMLKEKFPHSLAAFDLAKAARTK